MMVIDVAGDSTVAEVAPGEYFSTGGNWLGGVSRRAGEIITLLEADREQIMLGFSRLNGREPDDVARLFAGTADLIVRHENAKHRSVYASLEGIRGATGASIDHQMWLSSLHETVARMIWADTCGEDFHLDLMALRHMMFTHGQDEEHGLYPLVHDTFGWDARIAMGRHYTVDFASASAIFDGIDTAFSGAGGDDDFFGVPLAGW
jgi:hypothetical protein